MLPTVFIALLAGQTTPTVESIDDGHRASAARFEAYRPNYLLFGDNEDQVLFQFSFRYNLWPNNSRSSVFLAYTQRSFWDLYRIDDSSPFTENNYSPELVYRYRLSEDVLGAGFDQLQLGWQHESNGRGSVRSRSWDRLYIEQRYRTQAGGSSPDGASLEAHLRLWFIAADDPFNSDIEDFGGPGELTVNVASGETALGTFEGELFLRKGGYNFRFDRGAVQVGVLWSPPWSDWVQFTPKLYVQGFFGYLQSLERYDIRDDAVRIGLLLAE